MSDTKLRPSRHVLYLHGFRSSPRSAKAQALARALAERHPDWRWWCPQLPPSPRGAMDMLRAGVADWPTSGMSVVGSSLGGFYATYIATITGCRTVLLNPAVDPARDLARAIGTQQQWHTPDEAFHFEAAFIEELRALEVGALPQPQRCLAIIAKGDEVLDWREMVARFSGAHVRLLEGGDHTLSDFETQHMSAVMDFLEQT